MTQFICPHQNQLNYLPKYFHREMEASYIDSIEHDINVNFAENLPHQGGVISEIYQRPDQSYFQEPPVLQCQVDTDRIVKKLLPK